jgi:hypothetical protein
MRPVVVEHFVLSKQEAMLATRVNIHFLNRFPLEDILINFHNPLISFIANAVGGGLPNEMVPSGEDPYLAILHLSMLELALTDKHVACSREELEDVLNIVSTLSLLEAIHIVQ